MTASPSGSEALAVKAVELFSATEMLPAFEKVGAWFATVEPEEPEPDESLIGSGKAPTASLSPPLALA